MVIVNVSTLFIIIITVMIAVMTPYDICCSHPKKKVWKCVINGVLFIGCYYSPLTLVKTVAR